VVYGVTGMLAFSSVARRDAVLSDLQTRISGKSRWGIDVLEPAGSHYGPNGIYLELRFTSRLDADDLKARLENFATGQRAPQPGSWIRVHTCSHDDGTNECVIVAERVW
jgi:hypothetical protein